METEIHQMCDHHKRSRGFVIETGHCSPLEIVNPPVEPQWRTSLRALGEACIAHANDPASTAKGEKERLRQQVQLFVFMVNETEPMADASKH